MDRREFVKQSCLACLGGGVASLSGCAATHYTPGTIEPNGITVSKSEFTYLKKDKPAGRQFIIVQNDKLEFPIYVYRFSDTEYSAIWMRCSHQGNELQALGDQLHCPAHGSEFDNKGNVSQGPASHTLRSFPVKADGDKIFIDLRAV
jgi:Rieske Fe-S protein